MSGQITLQVKNIAHKSYYMELLTITVRKKISHKCHTRENFSLPLLQENKFRMVTDVN